MHQFFATLQRSHFFTLATENRHGHAQQDEDAVGHFGCLVQVTVWKLWPLVQRLTFKAFSLFAVSTDTDTHAAVTCSPLIGGPWSWQLTRLPGRKQARSKCLERFSCFNITTHQYFNLTLLRSYTSITCGSER